MRRTLFALLAKSSCPVDAIVKPGTEGYEQAEKTYVTENGKQSGWYDFEVYMQDDRYYLWMNTTTGFQNHYDLEGYLSYILREFTKFMERHDFDTKKEPDFHDIFSKGWNINTGFEKLEDAFSTFRTLVRGFDGESLYRIGEEVVAYHPNYGR